MEKEHTYYCMMLNKAELQKTDLLHFLELSQSSYRERSKLASALRRCLLERRNYKDAASIRAPIVEFLSANKGLMDRLSKVLGDVRREEKFKETRSYTPRILTPPVANSKSHADK